MFGGSGFKLLVGYKQNNLVYPFLMELKNKQL